MQKLSSACFPPRAHQVSGAAWWRRSERKRDRPHDLPCRLVGGDRRAV